jgi:hypothetical protein
VHDVDDDDGLDEDPEPFALSRSTHRWLAAAAAFELVSDILMAFYKLTTVFRDAFLQKYRYDNDRARFMDQVAVDIETIASGGLDATTKPAGTG